jgi:DNA-binding MarR family transcriptional regulator
VDEFSEKLNNLLVETFNRILKLEEQMLKAHSKMNLSISEFHVIEAVGKGEQKPKTISELAVDLGVTIPSVTNAIKKLEVNGYVQKVKSETDGRSILVSLTRLGKKVDSVHKYFHQKMVTALTKDLNEQEKTSLEQGINRLDKFFKEKLDLEK